MKVKKAQSKPAAAPKKPAARPAAARPERASPTKRDPFGAAVDSNVGKVHAALVTAAKRGRRLTKPDVLEAAGVDQSNVLNGLTYQTFTSDRGTPVCDHTAEGYMLTKEGLRAWSTGVGVLRTWQQTDLAKFLALKRK